MTRSQIARLSKTALEDERLGPQTLAFLLYLMNSEEINTKDFSVNQVADRFGMERGWWNEHFNLLIEFKYAKRRKYWNEKGHPCFQYAVTDKKGWLDDDRISPDLFTNYHHGLKRIYGTIKEPSPEPRPRSEPEISSIRPAQHQPTYVNEEPNYARHLDITRQDNEHLEILQFFMKYGFAAPKTPLEWEEAKKPGIRAWAKITETPLDWQAARLLNKRLVEPINKNALEIAWERWTSTSYRKERAIGVIEWYEELCKDIGATPWNAGQQYGRKKNATKGSNRHASKQHGTASAKYNEEDFTTV
jgi:hypothetical protein